MSVQHDTDVVFMAECQTKTSPCRIIYSYLEFAKNNIKDEQTVINKILYNDTKIEMSGFISMYCM